MPSGVYKHTEEQKKAISIGKQGKPTGNFKYLKFKLMRRRKYDSFKYLADDRIVDRLINHNFFMEFLR